MTNKTAYSLGHSNIGLEEFISFLQELEVRYLADVRSDPVSSYVPHFNKSDLEKVLEARGIQYIYMGKDLGGDPAPGSAPRSLPCFIYGDLPCNL